MLNQIKLFLEQHLDFSVPENTSEELLHIACVVLLMEMIAMDDNGESKERALVLSLVQKSFSLTVEQAATLIASAEQHRKQATDYFEFTSLINKQCSLEQKIQLIESLWKVAFVDGGLNEQEEYLVRKIADLLYVPHLDFIMAKHRVSST